MVVVSIWTIENCASKRTKVVPVQNRILISVRNRSGEPFNLSRSPMHNVYLLTALIFCLSALCTSKTTASNAKLFQQISRRVGRQIDAMSANLNALSSTIGDARLLFDDKNSASDDWTAPEAITYDYVSLSSICHENELANVEQYFVLVAVNKDQEIVH